MDLDPGPAAATPAWPPLQVTCGSSIKLKHVSNPKFRLHSHQVSYSRGSGQQSVTAFPSSDDGQSYWIVHGTPVGGHAGGAAPPASHPASGAQGGRMPASHVQPARLHPCLLLGSAGRRAQDPPSLVGTLAILPACRPRPAPPARPCARATSCACSTPTRGNGCTVISSTRPSAGAWRCAARGWHCASAVWVPGAAPCGRRAHTLAAAQPRCCPCCCRSVRTAAITRRMAGTCGPSPGRARPMCGSRT